jgi:DNA-binding NtrC family response regulator
MPLNLQVKLLRVLENGTFMRVGSTQLQQTDVRIIAATNRDAAEAVMRGGLREDLLYRLNVFPISLPALRERAGDIPLLARSFLDELARQEQTTKRFTPEAMERLKAYPWPGNVRELRNAVQRAWVMAPGAEIDGEWLPKLAGTEAPRPPQRPGAEPPADGHPALSIRVGTPLAEVERQLILATFDYCGQHKERTAALLGISMKTLYNRLKEYRL